MQLILASSSIHRKKQLKEIGIEFSAVPPLFDEDQEKTKDLPWPELCLLLAQKKAESLKTKYPNAAIIGSDQMLIFENQMYNKPKSIKEAHERLSQLQGQTHTLITSLYIWTAKKKFSHLDTTHLTMKPLNSDEIDEYIRLDQPIGCAGAYKYELNGKSLFQKVASQDKTSIIGLPTLTLQKILSSEFNQGPL